MKNLTRILTTVLCFAPFAYAAAAPVATTAGNNLTAFNPSNANNNQWATLSNGRYDSNVSAKVDFGNCNAVILRCAQPKCANGGCADISVASAIVKGCVQSNDSCKQYGDDLVAYMSAQLVANSNAKINEQNAAAANAAAQAAAQQSQQQMQQMQYQMQQMQQQMAQQQEQSQQQLQEALAQQAAQSAAALENMKTAATNAAMENEAGISAYQQDAINRGISADILERQKVTGQVLTEIENAEASLKEVKVAMNTAFEYAKCDSRGNNCEGPKRIKKWRELATEFLDPYYNSIDKIYEALLVAQNVGVDLSQIYMMLDNSCNSWGQYMCPHDDNGTITYSDTTQGQKGTPYVCPKPSSGLTSIMLGRKSAYEQCDEECYEKNKNNNDYMKGYRECANKCLSYCKPCTMLKTLTAKDEIYEGWVNAEKDADDNTTVVACASGILDTSKFFASRAKRKSGSGIVDIDKLDVWIRQTEPSKTYGIAPIQYCNASSDKSVLEKSMLTKVVPANNVPLCVANAGESHGQEDEYCGYINPIYAICDVHPYNAGKTSAYETTSQSTDNCNAKAIDACKKLTGIKIQDCNKIRWAKEENNKCMVKFCGAGYEPKNEGDKHYCLENIDWKENSDSEADKTGYLNAKREFDEEVTAKYGETREMVGLKTTVISQQMYKQYEYLNATLRRLKTQLEKAVLTAKLQAAGAKTEDSSSSSSGLLGGGSDSDKEIVLAGAENCWNASSPENAYSCIQTNLNLIKSNASTNKKKAAQQLEKTVSVASQWGIKLECKTYKKDSTTECATTACSDFVGGNTSNTTKITDCANALSIAVARQIANDKKEANKYTSRLY